MPIIKKVLNSSIVLVESDGDKDAIVMSKGIGYGRKAGEDVQLADDSRFFLPVSSMESQHLVELLDSIPLEYFEITKEIVEYAIKHLNIELNEHIYIALTDHLHFAVNRHKEQLITKNKMLWDIKNFYPDEFEVGSYALKLVHHKLGIQLPEEEAANVAFHIFNAQKNVDTHTNMLKSAKIIGNIVNIILYFLKTEPDQNSIHYARFKTHVQFFVNRALSNEMISSDDDFMYKQIESTYPKALECAEKVRTYMIREYELPIPNEEVAYLAVHIARLMKR